jgi:hypothetical protein
VDPYGCLPIYLYSLSRGSPSGTTLGVCTPHSTYPGADKGAQVPLFSQHESVKWRPSSVEHNVLHIPYRVRCRVSSGIVEMIASVPMTLYVAAV